MTIRMQSKWHANAIDLHQLWGVERSTLFNLWLRPCVSDGTWNLPTADRPCPPLSCPRPQHTGWHCRPALRPTATAGVFALPLARALGEGADYQSGDDACP